MVYILYIVPSYIRTCNMCHTRLRDSEREGHD